MKTCEDVQNRQPLDTLRWTNTYRYMHRCTAVRIDSRLKLADEPTQCCITPVSHVHNRCWKTGMITHACEWMGCDILAVNSQTHTDIHTYTRMSMQAGGLASLGSVIASPCIRVLPWCSLRQEQVQRAPMVLLTETLHTHTHTVKMERSFKLEPEDEISGQTQSLHKKKIDKFDRVSKKGKTGAVHRSPDPTLALAKWMYLVLRLDLYKA